MVKGLSNLEVKITSHKKNAIEWPEVQPKFCVENPVENMCKERMPGSKPSDNGPQALYWDYGIRRGPLFRQFPPFVNNPFLNLLLCFRK